MRPISIYGKIVIFKTLALSKIIYVACMSTVPDLIAKLVEQIHKDFIWNKKRSNVKHSSLIAEFSKGGLKDIDIPSKFKSLHLGWIKRIFDDNFHPWKNIPLHYIKSVSYNTSLFLPNLLIPDNILQDVPEFYRNMIVYWCELSQTEPSTSAMVFSESLYFNSFIKINNSPISPSFLGVKKNIFLSDVFSDEGLLIPWEVASVKFSMTNYFKWMQIANSIPGKWKGIVRGTQNLEGCCFDIHINKGNNV